ncbi:MULTISPECIES: GntR family transcriptional regulator [unclassified Micromonospora]|uniref:GntR family transcriptional regulator n=1 Tax=unclassified Micromonospora TaxID=2617518 RepID=UPI003A89483A
MADRVNTTDRVHAMLRESIISGELKAGSLHSVYKLADAYGVSRTPVREAVLRLADTGMVRVERNRGIRIRGVTVDDIREVFELRLIMEVPAASYAAVYGGEELQAALREQLAAMHEAARGNDEARFMKHDRALHDAISSVLGNRRLSAGVAALRDATQARGASTVHRSRDLAEIEREHAPILDALAAGDPAAAAARMGGHIVRTGTLLMRQVAEVSGEQVPTTWADPLLVHLGIDVVEPAGVLAQASEATTVV